MLSLDLAWLPVLTLQQAGVVNAVAGGSRPPSRKLWHIAGSKRRCWLPEKTTKVQRFCRPWDRRIYVLDNRSMTSRELTSGFDFWSWVICSWPWCISIQFGVIIDIFRNWRWRPPPSWIFRLYEFDHSGVLIVWYLSSVPNLVQISVIVTEIDARGVGKRGCRGVTPPTVGSLSATVEPVGQCHHTCAV